MGDMTGPFDDASERRAIAGVEDERDGVLPKHVADHAAALAREVVGTRVPTEVDEKGPDLAPWEIPDEATPGTTVHATWAEEQYQPVQFNTFRVGPFSATTVCRPGESVAQATVRLHAELDLAARQIRDQKVAEYLSALRKMCGR